MAGPNGLVWRVPKTGAQDVICHRLNDSREEYLVRWHSATPEQAVLSWHNLDELVLVLHLVQKYLKRLGLINLAYGHNLKPEAHSLKRKSPHDEEIARGSSSSVATSTSSLSNAARHRLQVYNGILQRKEGIFTAKESSGPNIVRVDAHQMPDAAMIEASKTSPVFNAVYRIRGAFHNQLQFTPGPALTFANEVDEETPSLSFRWIDDYVIGEGVVKLPDEAMTGCDKCRPDMGQGIGCEYTRRCQCLEYAAPDPSRIKAEDTEMQAMYEDWQAGISDDTEGLPKRFPYTSSGSRTGCLVDFYLESRNVIYECNKNCACGPRCKNRNVQFGRKVALEIFKTPLRGFGLRCLSDLKRGQFIDRYLGELITDAEADEREAAAGPGRASYLFWLDKHAGDNGLAMETCYVADGEAMGGPTRFINHSCDPNCRLFTVSYNKHDQRVYDLAFFALDNIPAGTELTFDYMDADELENKDDGDDHDEQEDARRGEMVVNPGKDQGKTKVKCLCGAERCRGVMWE